MDACTSASCLAFPRSESCDVASQSWQWLQPFVPTLAPCGTSVPLFNLAIILFKSSERQSLIPKLCLYWRQGEKITKIYKVG